MKYVWIGLLLAIGSSACSPRDKHQKHSIVRIRWVRDPENLSPLVQPNQNAVDALTLLHCSLLQLDFSTGIHVPALADSLPNVHLVGDSLTEISYQLRRAATWDSGRPVLASDVAFTLKLYQCPGLPNENARGQLSFIRDIRLNPAIRGALHWFAGGKRLSFASKPATFRSCPKPPSTLSIPCGATPLAQLANLTSLPLATPPSRPW